MKRLVICFCIIIAPILIHAQLQNNNWYFGNKAAIRFLNNGPVSITSSEMLSIEGCASVSDPISGNLLFYTNGLSIWNAANTVMPNGNGLLGGANTSSSQGVLIVAYPKQPKKFYVFTVDETINNAVQGFRYSVVDMNLDYGLGDIVPSQKNILVQNNVSERLAVAKKADGKGFWIMVHERGNNVFCAYELTSSGLNATPVKSNVGSIHSTLPQTNGDETMGCMKFNPSYSKLAVAIYAGNKVELFDFDPCSGIVSKPISIQTIDNPYGVEFSPDGSRLYYSVYYNAAFNGVIYQVDVQNANVAATGTLIGISSSINSQCVGALQLAPDGKIYVCINSESWLSCISAPNNLGPSCNFIDKAIILQQSGLSPSPGLLGLPQRVILFDTSAAVNYSVVAQNLCLTQTTALTLTSNSTPLSILWNFGDALSPNNTDTGVAVSHVYTGTGSYQVQAFVQTGCSVDTITKTIEIIRCDSNGSPCNWFIPNAFSPNQDGENDHFGPVGSCSCSEYQMTIFNRWGEAIFTTNNASEKWNGMHFNKACDLGSYFYLIRCNDANGNKKQYTGDVTLMR